MDPDSDVEDIDDTNNTLSISVPVKDTGRLRVLYVPLSAHFDGRDAPTCEQVQRVRDHAHITMRAIYPLGAGRLTSDASCAALVRASEPLPLSAAGVDRLLQTSKAEAKMGMADIVVGVVPRVGSRPTRGETPKTRRA